MSSPPLALAGQQTEYLRRRLAHARRPSVTIPRLPAGAERVPSFAQQRLWFSSRWETDPAASHRALNLRLRGALDADALERSLVEIARRHAPLRTNLFVEHGQLVPVVREDHAFRMDRVELAELESGERAARASQVEQQAFAQPFDLERDLMLRATLVCLAPREHILALTLHHIASDAWSDRVLLRELDALYRAALSSSAPDLPPLPVQYSDYAAFQRAELQGGTYERQLAYWREQLAGMASAELPRDDGPRCLTGSDRANAVRVALSQELVGQLRELSQRAGATLFMTLLAAFQLLLGRQTASEDIAVGTPIANRNHAEIENLIGCFVNTLVLRGDLAGNPTFAGFLERTRRICLAALDHQEFPFEILVQELQPPRELPRSPYFQAFFNLAPREVNPSLGDLVVERMEGRVPAARFDLSLYARDRGTTLELQLVYKPDSFAHPRMVEFLHQYTGLLEQIVAQPDRPVQRYSLVTTAAARVLPDPRRVLGEPAYPGVLETFLENAERDPSRLALEQESCRWSYAELGAAARMLAARLQQAGVCRGDVVAVTGARSPELMASLLGVWLGGGVLLALDPALPPLRRELMLVESNTAFVLETPPPRRQDATRFVLTPRERSSEKFVFDLAGSEPISECGPRAPGEPTYIFFTSGSTGKPKGILGCYKGINHFVHWQRASFRITADDRVAQLTSLSFDPMLRDLFLPLTSGATLCLPPPGLAPIEELTWLADARVTLLHVVPSRARFWLNNHPSPPPLGLNYTFFAGEPLTGELVARWRALCPPGSQVINLYGPTETSMAKSYYVVPAKPSLGVQSIGVPQPDTQLLVVNAEEQLCGIGEPGEIVIRTPFRTLGYLNPSPTDAARFTTNRATGDARDVVFRTGDLASYFPDGSLYLRGRTDSQVKVNGVRVELHEIEAVLSQHPGIKECVACIDRVDAAETRLVAYVVPAAPAPAAEELRQYLHARLLPAMVPAAFIQVDALPRLPSGKLDRYALSSLPSVIPAPESSFVAPHTELEIALAAIWGDLLNLERIGIHDNFFELGGHSLLAMQLTARISAQFGTDIPLKDFFATPTPQGIARYITAQSLAKAPMLQE